MESLCRTAETNIILYVYYTLTIIFKKIKSLVFFWMWPLPVTQRTIVADRHEPEEAEAGRAERGIT